MFFELENVKVTFFLSIEKDHLLNLLGRVFKLGVTFTLVLDFFVTKLLFQLAAFRVLFSSFELESIL
jgi:hypothetical protein